MARIRTAPIQSAALAAGLVFAFMGAPGAPAYSETRTVDTIMLKNRDEVLDAAGVKAAIDALVRDADTCSPRSMACICSHTASVDRLDNAYRSAVQRHPGWGQPNTGVEYDNLTGGGTVGIVMSNVKRELEMCGR
jgi:hypothetical protein